MTNKKRPEQQGSSPLVRFRVGFDNLERLAELGLIPSADTWEASEVNMLAKRIFSNYIQTQKAEQAKDTELEEVRKELAIVNAKLDRLTQLLENK